MAFVDLTSTTIPEAYTSWSSDNNIPVSLRIKKGSGAEGWRCDPIQLFKIGKMKNTTIGGGSAEGPVNSTPTLPENRDRWLHIDDFSENYLEFEDSAAKDKPQKMGNIEDKSGSSDAKGGQAEDRPYEVDHNGNGAGDSRDDIIVDAEMDGIEMNNGGRL